jgi:hypothetical protein
MSSTRAAARLSFSETHRLAEDGTESPLLPMRPLLFADGNFFCRSQDMAVMVAPTRGSGKVRSETCRCSGP